MQKNAIKDGGSTTMHSKSKGGKKDGLDLKTFFFFSFWEFLEKGWPPIAKLEKIQDGIARFGCNLGDLIAYLCRLLTPVDTQIGQC